MRIINNNLYNFIKLFYKLNILLSLKNFKDKHTTKLYSQT